MPTPKKWGRGDSYEACLLGWAWWIPDWDASIQGELTWEGTEFGETLPFPLLGILGFSPSIQISGRKGLGGGGGGGGEETGCWLSSPFCPLTAREGLSVPAAVMERKLMKYGPLELQARPAFLFTLLYTSSHPCGHRETKQNKQSNKTKQNPIVLQAVARLGSAPGVDDWVRGSWLGLWLRG